MWGGGKEGGFKGGGGLPLTLPVSPTLLCVVEASLESCGCRCRAVQCFRARRFGVTGVHTGNLELRLLLPGHHPGSGGRRGF